MCSERQMYFVRNIIKLDEQDAKRIVREFEVTADSHIVGEIEYWPYYLTIWEFAYKRSGDKRLLCLRVAEKPYDDKPWENVTKEGYYHGGGIADEIVALASLFLRRRLLLGRQVRSDNRPQMLSKNEYSWIDKSLIDGESNLADLRPWFDFLRSLNPALHQRYILAVRLYQRALEVIEEQPDIAYLNLVSSIEVLCYDFPIGTMQIADIDAGLARVIEQITDEDLRREISDRILKRERFIRRRFAAFIKAHIEPSFWNDTSRPKYGRVSAEQLHDILYRIYDQRCRTLHTGEPFPPDIFHPPHPDSEIMFALNMSVGKRKWDSKQFIPYPHFFERLVNHVLKVYLKRNQKARHPE